MTRTETQEIRKSRASWSCNAGGSFTGFTTNMIGSKVSIQLLLFLFGMWACVSRVNAQPFWAIDDAGLTVVNPSGTTNSHIDNGNTSYPANPSTDSYMNVSGSVACGVGFDLSAHANFILPNENTLSDDCSSLFLRAHYLEQGGEYRKAYDTGRYYIEHCANTSHSANGFSITGGGVQFMSNDNMRWLDYREWLKTVLYLDTTSDALIYYCTDAAEIVGTFAYVTPKGRDYNGAIAVIDFLLNEKHCSDNRTSLFESRKGFRQDQLSDWQDTVKNPELTPLDTLEPNIDDLGLKILRGKPSGVSMLPLRSKQNILQLRVSASPFVIETELMFELSQPVALKIDILDVLGREVGHPSIGQLFAPGKHLARVSGKDIPSGTLYARLTAANGEVRTVKMVKRK
ncbi:MAG: hypothetical protein ABI252_14080 [Candidatus Kapaibacterium sp.]